MENGTGSRSDEALLGLLLAYAIPPKDVLPTVKRLVAQHADLVGVLAADPEVLCRTEGINRESALLLKVVYRIIARHCQQALPQDNTKSEAEMHLPTLQLQFEEITASTETREGAGEYQAPRPVRLFSKAVLQEAVDLLPRLPDTRSLSTVREFLRATLHYSGAQTRERHAQYIVQRMFPQGYADEGLRYFARGYAGHQALRDVCYYRFCAAEPLMYELVDRLVLPNVGKGRLERLRIRDYLVQRFPATRRTIDCGQAIVQVLVAGGLAKADRKSIAVGYRDVSLPAFAFILASEFPEPGMYDMAKLERNSAIRAMLWRPDKIIPALYELRNMGLLAKVSEIDSVRQFTTRWSLDEVVHRLTVGGSA